MKKIITAIYQSFLYLTLIEYFLVIKPSNAFIPIINEPSRQELESTSKQIGKTATHLIQLGQNNEAIKLLKLATKLNPKEKELWAILAEAEIRSDNKYQAISSLNQIIKLEPKDQNIYFSIASIYMDLNQPKKAKVFIKKGLASNKNKARDLIVVISL